MAINYLSVGEAARLIPGANPRAITDLFYRGQLRDDLCPLAGGRRLIPEDYLPQVTAALRRAGKLRPAQIGEVHHG